MIYFLNSQGTTELVESEPIYQGSSMANQITVVGPFSQYNEVTVNFKLPNGLIGSEIRMTPVPLTNNISINGKECSAWTLLINERITEFAGTVQLQFRIRNSNSLLACYGTQFVVQKGVQPILPNTPTQDIYTQILKYLTTVNEGISYGIKSITYSSEQLIIPSSASVIACVGGADIPYRTIDLSPTSGILTPYFSDYMTTVNGATGITGKSLIQALGDKRYNLIAYNPKRTEYIGVDGKTKMLFSPYGIALNFDTPQNIGVVAFYGNIYYSNDLSKVPDRYYAMVYDNNNKLISEIKIDNPTAKRVDEDETVPANYVTLLNVGKENVSRIEFVVRYTTDNNSLLMFSSGCLPIMEIDIFAPSNIGTYTFTKFNGDTFQIDIPLADVQISQLNAIVQKAQSDIESTVNTGKTEIESAINDGKTEIENTANTEKASLQEYVTEAKTSADNAKTSENNAKASEDNAKDSADDAEKALISLNSQKGKADGIATLDNDGVIPANQIPPIVRTDYFEVTTKEQLTTLSTAETGDIAYIVTTDSSGNKKLGNSWILLGNGVYSNIDNWIEQSSSTAGSAAFADQAEYASNAGKINGVSLQVMTETQYNELIDKTGIIFVTYDESGEQT